MQSVEHPGDAFWDHRSFHLAAAFWAIAWPGWIAAWVTVLGVWNALGTPESLFLGFFVWWVSQAFLVTRLVRKKFRGFRIDILRENQPSSLLSRGESGQLAWTIVSPQVWIVIAGYVVFTFLESAVTKYRLFSPDRALVSILGLQMFFFIGPGLVLRALSMPHRGFSLRMSCTHRN